MSRSPGRLLLLGGGGHAAVVAEIARAAGWTVLGALDDDPAAAERLARVALDRLGSIADVQAIRERLGADVRVHAAIGDAATRQAWSDLVADTLAPAIVHPSAVVSPSAHVGAGVSVGATAVINARARVERGVIVNSGAIVEHDVLLEPFCHVAPGAVLGGGCRVGASALVGAGATVLPSVAIGSGAVLGAGSVAVAPLPDGARAAGCPARIGPAALSAQERA